MRRQRCSTRPLSVLDGGRVVFRSGGILMAGEVTGSS